MNSVEFVNAVRLFSQTALQIYRVIVSTWSQKSGGDQLKTITTNIKLGLMPDF